MNQQFLGARLSHTQSSCPRLHSHVSCDANMSGLSLSRRWPLPCSSFCAKKKRQFWSPKVWTRKSMNESSNRSNKFPFWESAIQGHDGPIRKLIKNSWSPKQKPPKELTKMRMQTLAQVLQPQSSCYTYPDPLQALVSIRRSRSILARYIGRGAIPKSLRLAQGHGARAPSFTRTLALGLERVL